MKRNHFGSWGLGLSQEEFAAALAALGAFQHALGGLMRWLIAGRTLTADAIYRHIQSANSLEGPVGWGLGPVPPEELDSLDTEGTARAFAEAWAAFAAGRMGGLRLELHLRPEDDYFWIAEQLLRPSVGAASLYVRADEPRVEVGWNWPLRVGFLRDEGAAALRRLSERRLRHSGLQKLVEFVSLEAEGDRCDLLLMPGGAARLPLAGAGRGVAAAGRLRAGARLPPIPAGAHPRAD